MATTGYPTEPCTKPYNAQPLFNTTLANLKQICDQQAVQIEIMMKPTELKLRVIKKIGKQVKKSERVFLNEDIATRFNPQTVMTMVYDVSNQYL